MAKPTVKQATTLKYGVFIFLILFSCIRLNAYEPLSLKQILHSSVLVNNGYGGGTLRVESVHSQVLWEGSSGTAVCNSDEKMRNDLPYEIASTSKTFTAVVVLTLVQERKLDLDNTLGEILGDTIEYSLLEIEGDDYSREITIRQLLNHTSGLPDYFHDPPYEYGSFNSFIVAYLDDVDRFWKPDEILEYIPDLSPIGKPGGDYHYSDTNYLLLGLVIEKITGKELHDVYRERLFLPLKMEDTYLPYREIPSTAKTESHRYEGDWDLCGRLHQTADWAGGGLISSNRDLSLFIRALAAGKIIQDPDILEEMFCWIPTGETDIEYGLGLFHLVLDDDLGELWGHDGYGNSFMYWWPQEEISMVGTLNQTENDWWPIAEEIIVQIR